MDEGKFKKDWEKFNDVQNLAMALFSRGCSIEEAKSLVLQSKEYKEWLAEKRSFMAEFEEDRFYNDLKAYQKLLHHVDEIDSLARAMYFREKENHFHEREIFLLEESLEDDWLPLTLGLHLNTCRLAYELVQFGKLIGLDSPMPVMNFLPLLNGTAMLPEREEIVDRVVENKTAVMEFLGKFRIKYGKREA
ncbi:hypothetical protein [Syntrophomonas wolfei]|uniref:hypothetical protein n=1 Tax=Syntrophomonas wolfei TaxID=863 RepID=UPI000E9E2B75|nr:hypothetical protein [Syntrophomonas wolfei]HBR02102.1 hypothetical protein [Ruminiclostridium sp.]